MDTLEIVTLLNRLLANYTIFQQKLKKYYWNISGQDFFYLSEHFKAMKNGADKNIDTIAERIRLFGQTPLSTFAEYIEVASVKEERTENTSFEAVQIILENIRILIDNMEEGINATKKNNDNGTEFFLKSCIFELEKDHWKLTSWLKQNV
jgi:starvation-inducible DNA-binding protein